MSGGVFPALSVQPLLGRFFTQQEDDQKEPVVVLSYSLWQSRFHGNRNVLGSKILLDRKPYVVVGVMPRNFEFPLVPGQLNRSELWVPISFTEAEVSPGGASNWSYQMVESNAGAGAGRCATRGARDDEELSAVHGKPAYYGSGALAA